MAVEHFIPEIWNAEILENWRQAVVLAPTLTDYSGAMRVGNVMHISGFANPAIIDYKAAGRTITPGELIDAGLAFELDHEKAWAAYFDDVDQAQAAGSMSPVTADAGRALAEDFETAAAAAIVAGGIASAHAAVTTGDDAYGLVLELRRQLSQAKAPLGDRYLAVDPLMSEILLASDSKLSQFDTSGSPAGLRGAIIGELLGFTVLESALLGNGTDAFCAAYHTSAVGMASQMDKTESLRATDRFADIVRGLHVYGVEVVRASGVITFTNS